MARRCEACPECVAVVCRHAFGIFWGDKSRDGEGCEHPLDGVAEVWRRAGWTPNAPQPRQKAPVSVPFRGRVIALAVRADAPSWLSGAAGAIPPKMPRRPVRPTASRTPPKAPARPKVSAEIVRQAELFFGRGV